MSSLVKAPWGALCPQALPWLWGGAADLELCPGLGSQQHQPGVTMSIAGFQLQEGTAAVPAVLSGTEQVM